MPFETDSNVYMDAKKFSLEFARIYYSNDPQPDTKKVFELALKVMTFLYPEPK